MNETILYDSEFYNLPIFVQNLRSIHVMKNAKVMLFLSTILIFLSALFPCQSANMDESIMKESFSSLINRANSYENINNDSILIYANKALQLAESENNIFDQLKAKLFIIDTEIKTGKYGDAIKLCIAANQLAIKNDQIGIHIELLVYTGIVYQKMGFSNQALDYFHKAQQIAEENNYRIVSNDIHYYIGSVFHDIGDMNQSRNNLQLSISNSIQNSYPRRLFESYYMLSNTFKAPDSIDRYITLAAIVLESNPGLKYEQVVLRNKQGYINNARGNLNLSKKQYLEAIHVSITNHFNIYLARLYNNLTYLLITEKQYDSANNVLGKALAIVIDLRMTDLEATILSAYCEYYIAIGDYKKAFAYQESSMIKSKEYREQQQVQESLFLSTVIENEHREKDILHQENKIALLWEIVLSALLILSVFIGLTIYFRQKFIMKRTRLEAVEKGKELEIADAMIHGQDVERKKIAMDLHDGLSARLGALRLKVDGLFNTHENYNQISDSLVDIYQNVRDLSHRMLPVQLEELGLPMTIKSLVSSINKSGKFTVEFETNLTNRLSDNLEVNLYHLIHELITNATKHSNGNNINIQLFDQGDMLNLSVEDNGSGFNIPDDNSGIGLKNVKTRVEYLRGKYMVETDELRTVFMIEIPIFEPLLHYN